MTKFSMLMAVSMMATSAFAQRYHATYTEPGNIVNPSKNSASVKLAQKTTSIGDTITLHNIADTATLALYRLDSGGYATGINYYNDLAFAERFDFSGYDSTLQVIGVFALFGGTVNPASTKSVTFYAWDQGPQQLVTDTFVYSGFPYNILDTITYPLTQLGISVSGDTLKSYMFLYPTAFLGNSFFVGYSVGYNYAALGGDTIGLYTSLNGDRTSPKYSLEYGFSDGDTVITTVVNVQNATLGSDYNWYDNYSQNDSLFNDLAIYPIVITGTGTVEGLKGVTRNNLTFFGNYPNPAVNSTNIKFSLAVPADVTIQVTDMNGRIISTINTHGLTTGEHIVPVNTSMLATGDYLYLVRTSLGDGVAGKLTVVK